jgi:hypothetical protein
MLSSLLDKDTCAKCRICCTFESYEVWETPNFTPSEQEAVKRILPEDTEMSDISIPVLEHHPESPMPSSNSIKRFRVTKLDDGDMFYCPALDNETGCKLGDEKPFECQIWPFRIMKLNGQLVITVSPLCNAVFTRPLSTLVTFMKEELLDEMLKYAQEYPTAVKEYDDMYPILLLVKS